MKTWNAKDSDVEKSWWIIDATDQTLGRLATEIATLLRGKHKPIFTPHVDTGDFVVVINSDKIKLSGNKWADKKYYHHTGFFGSIKDITAKELLEKDSTDIIVKSVRGMLPRNKLAVKLLSKMKVYKDAEHPHQAQNPQTYTRKFN